MDTVRMNISVPIDFYNELIQKIDVRKRSNFLVASAQPKLKTLKKRSKSMTYGEKLMEFKTKHAVKSRPGWEDIDSIVNWVNEGRSASNRDYSYILNEDASQK